MHRLCRVTILSLLSLYSAVPAARAQQLFRRGDIDGNGTLDVTVELELELDEPFSFGEARQPGVLPRVTSSCSMSASSRNRGPGGVGPRSGVSFGTPPSMTSTAKAFDGAGLATSPHTVSLAVRVADEAGARAAFRSGADRVLAGGEALRGRTRPWSLAGLRRLDALARDAGREWGLLTPRVADQRQLDDLSHQLDHLEGRPAGVGVHTLGALRPSARRAWPPGPICPSTP